MNNEIFAEFRVLLQDEMLRARKTFSNDQLKSVADYASQRALHLSKTIGQPGYELAFQAERDNIALKLGIVAVDSADAADARIIGVITGALGIASRALMAAV